MHACGVACRILIPLPGIKPVPSAVEAWSLNHWTTREAPAKEFLRKENKAGGTKLLNYITKL